MEYIQHFTTLPRIVFLTINPNKGLKVCANTKIGKWTNILKTMSDNFVITKEETGGYHFHAIMSLKKDIKLRYIKNVHFKYIDVSNKPYIPENTYSDLCESVGELIPHTNPQLRDEVLNKIVQARKEATSAHNKQQQPIRKSRKLTNITKVIQYITKDNPIGLDNIVFIKDGRLKRMMSCALGVEACLLPQEASKQADTSI